MNIDKGKIDQIISSFKEEKDQLKISSDLLVKFDTGNAEHVACLSYLNGTGGYYMLFLKYLIEKLELRNVIELGNQTGMSTVAMYDAIRKDTAKKLYTVDIEKDQRFCPDEMHISKNVSFIFGDVCSNDVIKQLPRNIDLLFTDTLHYDFQLQDEYEIYQHLLADTALVAIDDIRSNDKGKLFDSLDFDKWDLTELCHVSGWGLFLYKRKTLISDEEREKLITLAIHNIWEKKVSRLQKELDIKNKTYWKAVKNLLKKLTPLYKIYTRTDIAIHKRFFKKTVRFYER
mgnify:CR=1 FL=1